MEDDCDQGDNLGSDRKKRSKVWNHFDVADAGQFTAVCKVCSKVLSYRTSVTNLWKHYQNKHTASTKGMITKLSDDEGSIEALETDLDDEEIEDEQPIDKRKILRQGAWEYFEIYDEDEKIAICTFCKEQFSYRTSSTNLARHLQRKHYSEIDDPELFPDVEEKSTQETGEGRRSSVAWDYFTVSDPERRVATCNICGRECSYLTTVTNLIRHVQRKHSNALEDMDETDNEGRRKSRKRSPVWMFFKPAPGGKGTVCLICNATMSLPNIGNLKRHLVKKHPAIKLRDGYDTQKMIIGSDGQLYEIDETDGEAAKTESMVVEDDAQSDPMELNAVYLDDYKDNTETERKSKPPKLKRKRKMYRYSDNNESSDDEVTFQKRYVKKKPDSIDQFGRYIVTLLKQLPKQLSNQLQADFVKQVMNAELSYNTQKVVVPPSNGYAITITETRPSESNDMPSVAEGGGES